MHGDVWTKEQITVILKSLALRIKRTPEEVTIKREGSEVRFDNIAQAYKTNVKENFFISLSERNNRIFVNIADQRDHCEISPLPWKDKELKAIKQLLLSFSPRSAGDILLQNMFPEAIDVLVEDVILKDKASE